MNKQAQEFGGIDEDEDDEQEVFDCSTRDRKGVAAMLHLYQNLLAVRSALPLSVSLHRFLSATAAVPTRFAVEEYLTTTCHLTLAQALKASKHLSHLKSPSKPDAVLAFLSGLGLSSADIATVVAADPRILSSSVDKNLKHRAANIRELGFSAAQIPRFIRLSASVFRSANVPLKLGFWISFFGSAEKVLHVLKNNTYLLTSDLEKVVKPNIALLTECGLGVCDIAKLCLPAPRLLTTNPERVKALVARAEELGVPRGSGMFKQALMSVSCLGQEKVASKREFLKKVLAWSEVEASTAVSKMPMLLRCSEEKLRRVVEFLTTVVGLDVKYIARRPALLMYSLERRLAPRHYVLNVLKGKGLVRSGHGFYTAATLTDKSFLQRFVHPHKDAVPDLADVYAAACRGKLPIGATL